MTKQIRIGDISTPGNIIQVPDDCTVGQALQIAGMQLQAAEKIASMHSGAVVSLNDLVNNGEEYIVTHNHVSG